MKLPIITIPNKILRQKSIEIKRITPDIFKLAQDMLDTYKADGVGLAAPQVGQNIRLCVIGNPKSRDGEKTFAEKILINPIITARSKTKERDIEGCLSVPVVSAVVERNEHIDYSYLDLDGKKNIVHASGFEARVIQHEIDHLDGILFTDRLKKYNVVFFGTPDFAVPALTQLIQHPQFNVVGVVCETDKAAGRGHLISESPVKVVAAKNKLPVIQPITFNVNHTNKDYAKDASLALKQIKDLKPDFIIVAAYGKILPSHVLDLAKIAPINIHPSLLPLYRGPDPIRAAIINGDTKTGVSIMVMSPEMDAGPVLSMVQIKITTDDNYQTLSHKLSEIGADQLIYTLEELLSDRATLYKQNEDAATYSTKSSANNRILDWHKNAFEIHNLIRAYSPHDGVTTTINNTLIKVLTSEYKDGALKIKSVQLAGKKVITFSQFQNGYPNLYKSLQNLVSQANARHTVPEEVEECKNK